LTDILILLLPMKFIWGLGVPLQQKLRLALIFGLGALCVPLSHLRPRKQKNENREIKKQSY
jgi:hypothetical protein